MILLNNYYLNVSMLIEDGYLEDLNPYLNESSIFDRADFLESVLDAYTFDGKLIAIPKHFMLHTLVEGVPAIPFPKLDYSGYARLWDRVSRRFAAVWGLPV